MGGSFVHFGKFRDLSAKIAPVVTFEVQPSDARRELQRLLLLMMAVMQPDVSKRQTRLSWAFLPLLLLLAFSAYSNTFHSPLLLDDYHTFVTAEQVYLKNVTPGSLIALSQTMFGWNRWIPMLSFALDHSLGKGDIVFFHVTNLIIHLASMLAVFFLAAQLFTLEQRTRNTPHIVTPAICCAVWVAGIWALNPVQTNAVTYLVQRMASLQTLFFVLCVATYLFTRRMHRGKTHHVATFLGYAATLWFALCAFLSKENSAMLPVMLVITEIWFFQPDMISDICRWLKGKSWPFWIVASLAGLVTSLYILGHFSGLLSGYSGRHFTLSERLLTEARIVVWYLSVLLWPDPSRLSIEHDVVLSRTLWDPLSTLFCIVLLVSTAWLSIRFRRRFPLITYGMLWFLLNLVIESSIVPLELIFEHRLYLPSIGFFIAFVAGVVAVAQHAFATADRRKVITLSWCCFSILVSCLTLLTFTRNEAWQNILTINQDAVRKAPLNARAHANLAVAWSRLEQYPEAIAEAQIAIGLGQNGFEEYTVAANMIVGALREMGETHEAIARGNELLANRSKDADAGALPALCLNLAEANFQTGALQEALSKGLAGLEFVHRTNKNSFKRKMAEHWLTGFLNKVAPQQIDLDGDGSPDPGELPVKTWIAARRLQLGDRESAKRLLGEAIDENPESLESQDVLRTLQEEDLRNQEQQRRWSFSNKYVHQPTSRFNAAMAMAFLIRSHPVPTHLLGMGEFFMDYALRLEPQSADAHLLKGWYHFEKDEADEAVVRARRALELDPRYAKAWLGLGFFLAKANQPEEAIAAFQKTLELYPGYPQRLAILDILSHLRAKEAYDEFAPPEPSSKASRQGIADGASATGSS
jgi:protein O-mannosyl-transferase